MLKYDRSKFTNCLRIAIQPGWHESERIEGVKNFCLKHGFNNVMLFINAEEFNLGHITKEEAKPWVETMKRAKAVLNGVGISVSANPWCEWGHLDRGRKLKEGQNFTTMTDMHGNKCTMVACFYDENWREYYIDFVEYLLKELEPDVYWIEDDFRLHNHGGLEYGGCFCDLHMKKYNEKLGTNYSRDEFVKKVFSEGGLTPERKAWADVSREGILEMAEIIGKKIAQVSPNTDVAIMSSDPWMHALEARDWHGLFNAFAQGREKNHRIHLPCYYELNAKNYYHGFHSVSMAVRALGPNDVRVLPELENGYFSPYAKDKRFLRYQVESAIPLIIDGMTYDIFDFVGNGVIESYGYGDEIEKINPYLQTVKDLRLSFGDIKGVITPIDEKAVYYTEYINHWMDLSNRKELIASATLSGLGLSCCYSTEKEFSDRTIFLTAGNLRYLSNDQINEIFKNNFVILEGYAVLSLIERGIGELVGAKKAEFIPYDIDVQSYEQDDFGLNINGIEGFRGTAQSACGHYVRIDYEKEPLTLTNMYDSRSRVVGKGITLGENFCVLPYVMDEFRLEQLHDLRKFALLKVLQLKGKGGLAFSKEDGVSSYLYETKDNFVIMLINNTVSSFNSIELYLKNLEFEGKVFEVSRMGGVVECDSVLNDKNTLVINTPLEYLSTKTIILKKTNN